MGNDFNGDNSVLVAEMDEVQEREDRLPLRVLSRPRRRFGVALTWVCIAMLISFYAVRAAKIGMDLRWDFWSYWENNRFYGDIGSAFRHGSHVLDECRAVEADDRNALTPAQRTIDDQQIARGEKATLDQQGPGLFESPLTMGAVVQRWHRLRPVYGIIMRGWVQTYDNLQRDYSDGEYGMDYPPLRCLVMTLWTWKVQTQYPGLDAFPNGSVRLPSATTGRMQTVTPDVASPLLKCNMFFEGVSAIAMFFLVWIWTERRSAMPIDTGWRSRWGDSALLVPVICYGVFSLLQPYMHFDWVLPHTEASLIDDRIVSLSWWIFVTVQFIALVSLARILPRPFRGVICGLVAATLIWFNPATILDSFGWPQWEAWLPPFFLVAAVLVSLDWWLTAGIVLAFGCMFKGQLLFISPVLLLSPLFAGWFGRFFRIIAGMGLGAAIVVSPWLINVRGAGVAQIVSIVFAAALICILSIFRKPVGRELRRFSQLAIDWGRERLNREPRSDALFAAPETRYHFWIAIVLAMITAAFLSSMGHRSQDPALKHWTLLFTLAILTIPWFVPRRAIAPWLVFVTASAIWLAGATQHGSFSWWDVGFVYGTQKHQAMQLGQDSLSNLSSILENRYRWQLHDTVGNLHLPGVDAPLELDVQTSLLIVFGLCVVLCSAAAAVHLRRNDKKFLVALVAPWVLFVSLLTQMAARYMTLAAVVSAALVGISVSMSLLQLLITAVACVMLGNQMLHSNPGTAPLTYAITQPTFPDSGWLTLLLAATILVAAVAPSKRLE